MWAGRCPAEGKAVMKCLSCGGAREKPYLTCPPSGAGRTYPCPVCRGSGKLVGTRIYIAELSLETKVHEINDEGEGLACGEYPEDPVLLYEKGGEVIIEYEVPKGVKRVVARETFAGRYEAD